MKEINVTVPTKDIDTRKMEEKHSIDLQPAKEAEMKEQLLNCTPHEINIGERSFPPTGMVARVQEEFISAGKWNGVRLVTGTFGDVEGLPAEEEGTLYIVSRMVVEALPNRKDLVSPAEMVRDENGRIVGCLSLLIGEK